MTQLKGQADFWISCLCKKVNVIDLIRQELWEIDKTQMLGEEGMMS